jgi:hypothetical protein
MANLNDGRDVVIMGHSQGTQHLTRLVREEIDPDPRLRRRLAMALLIGYDVYVPEGQLVGGSLQNIPLCSQAGESGCVIAFNSFAKDLPPAISGWNGSALPAGMVSACVNPATLAGNGSRFQGSFFPKDAYLAGLSVPEDVSAPYVLYRDFYAGECVSNQNGFRYLAVSTEPQPDDQRENHLPLEALSAPVTTNGTVHELGLHILDYYFPLQDLVTLVGQL